MRSVFLLIFAPLLLIGPGCSHDPVTPSATDPTSTKPQPIAKNESAEQKSTAAQVNDSETHKPNEAATPSEPPKPTDPLETAARALKPTEVHIELTDSKPAGESGDAAEYEWTILGRIAASEIEVPEHIKFQSPLPTEPGWNVTRLRLKFSFDKSADNYTFDENGAKVPKDGARQIQMEVKHAAAGSVPGISTGTTTRQFDARPGSGPFTLRMRAWMQPKIDVPGANNDTGDEKNLLEVTKAPLDELIVPLLKTADSFEGSKEFDLIQIDGKSVTLKIVR